MDKREFLKSSLALGLGATLLPGVEALAQTPSESQGLKYPFAVPDLAYPHAALEPHIDKQTMELHHGKHHKAYVDNLNKALAGTPLEKKSLDYLVRNAAEVPVAVRNNAGGHYNHSLFWQLLSPKSTGKPLDRLGSAINRDFGSFATFQQEFEKAGKGVFGSGWVWLMKKKNLELFITTSPNQDNPLMRDLPSYKTGEIILGLDVWEHAYYLKYQNRRADYLSAWWNLVNWEKAEELYKA